MIKPFALSELVARIRAILRRGRVRLPDQITVADLTIDPARRHVTRGGSPLNLTVKEFNLIWLLACNAGEVVSRTIIAEQVWDMNFHFETNVIDVHIRRLRAKVDDPFEERLIHTIRGAGYMLTAASCSLDQS